MTGNTIRRLDRSASNRQTVIRVLIRSESSFGKPEFLHQLRIIVTLAAHIVGQVRLIYGRVRIANTADFMLAMAIRAVRRIENTGLQRLAVDAAGILNANVIMTFRAGLGKILLVNHRRAVRRFLYIVRSVTVVAGCRRSNPLLNSFRVNTAHITVKRIRNPDIRVCLERDPVMAGCTSVWQVFRRSQ